MKLIEEVIHDDCLHLLEEHNLSDLISERGEQLEASFVRLVVHDTLVSSSSLICLLFCRLNKSQSVNCEASGLTHGFKLLLLLKSDF